MDENKPSVKDNTNREMAIRTQALDMAIRSSCGQSYNTENHPITDHNKIVEGAKAFESYIRGMASKEPVKLPIVKLDEAKPEPTKDEWK